MPAFHAPVNTGDRRTAHLELTRDGFTLGIAAIEAVRKHYGLRRAGGGHWNCCREDNLSFPIRNALPRAPRR